MIDGIAQGNRFGDGVNCPGVLAVLSHFLPFVDKGLIICHYYVMPSRINSIVTIEDTFIAYAVGDNGLILKSVDGGATWQKLRSPVTVNLYSICFPGQAAIGYACGDLGTIIKTQDEGINWEVVDMKSEIDLRAIKFPLTPEIGFAGGDKGTVLRTADGGKTWEKLLTATTEKIMDIHFPADVITGYAVGLNSTILKTITGGSIWFSQTENIDELTPGTHFTAVHFPADDLVGFMTTTLGRVFFTSNGGEVWRALSLEFFVPPLYSLDMRHDTMGGFCVGAKGTVIHTLDGGETWERINPGTDKDLFSIRFFPDGIIGIIGGDEQTLLLSNNSGYTWAPAIIRG